MADMLAAEIISINTGLPQPISYLKKEVPTGIFKRPVSGRVYLSSLNFEGDRQADLVHHGGVEKAVCVYAYEHYAYWENELGLKLDFAAFGENLTIRGMTEDDVCIGDTFQLGQAVVQLSQPRQPCYKLSARYGLPHLLSKVEETGYTGFYFRVLKEGDVAREDGLVRIERDPRGITVSYANRVMHHDKYNLEAIRKVLEVETLSVHWRATLSSRLAGERTDTKERVTGER